MAGRPAGPRRLNMGAISESYPCPLECSAPATGFMGNIFICDGNPRRGLQALNRTSPQLLSTGDTPMKTALMLRAGTLAGLLCAALLTACGGGGYSAPSSASPPPVVAPSALTYTSPATATIGVAITTLSPTVTGTVTSYAVSPALPAGLSIDGTTGAITGTATQLAATATYTVTATNSAGNTTFGLSLQVAPPAASAYSQSNLVSDGSVTALHTDVNLKNPWGVVFATGAPVWVTNNVTNTSTLYDASGTAVPLVVTVPSSLSGTAAPTGIVANPTTDFTVTNGTVTAASRFIFSSEGGTISA